jgi:ribosomal protein L7/L12
MTQRPLPENVRAALSRGEKIEAIQLLRAAGLGLKQAKDLVDGRGAPPQAHQAPGAAMHANDDVLEALAGGHRFRAIRLYRRRTGVDLRQAKEAVERLALQTGRDPSGLAPGEVPRRAAGQWVLPALGVAIVIAIYLWLR